MTKVQVLKDKVLVLSSEHYIERTKNAYNITMSFSDDWYGLDKKIIFKTDSCEEALTTQSKEITFAIPSKIFSQPSAKLLIGVFGYRGCELVLNTSYAKLGKVEKGVNPCIPDSSTSEAIAGIPPGGLTNQVLSKKSDADGDVYWRDAKTMIFLSAPIGTIVAYTGKIEDIPASYALCDGKNGTPDLRNTFIIGAGGYYDPGDASRVQLQDHSYKTEFYPVDKNTSDIGFYALCFIQKIYLTDLDKKESMTAYEIALQQGFQGDEKEWLASLRGKSAYEVAVDNGFEGSEKEWLDMLSQGLRKVEDATIMAKSEFPYEESGCYLLQDVYFVKPGETRDAQYINFKNEIVYVDNSASDRIIVTSIDNDKVVITFDETGRIATIDRKTLVDQILENVKTIQGEPGKSAYQIALDKGFKGSESEWLASLQGPPGKDGKQGEPGKEGPAGKDGKQGQNGAPGADGLSAYQIAIKNGFSGSEQQWLASLKGSDGKDGGRGPQGLPGEDGKKGPAGVNGKSAYQLALDHGFRGTEAEWVESLKGIDGKNGKDGKDGVDGAVGPEGKRGPAGESAYQAAVGNGFTGSESEWLALLKGADGKNGRDGINGSDGESAYAIAVKNGFTGSEQQWLTSLKGADGQNGINGEDGKSAYQIAVDNGFTGTTSEWLASLKGSDGQDGLSAYEVAVKNGYDGTEQEWLASIVQDLTGVYRYKGSVANYESLPTVDLAVGDVYNVNDTDMNYAWDGEKWDPLGSIFTSDAISKEEADARYLKLTGGSLSGSLTADSLKLRANSEEGGARTETLFVALEEAMSTISSDFISIAGKNIIFSPKNINTDTNGTVTFTNINVQMENGELLGLPEPSSDDGAANKLYVDQQIETVDQKIIDANQNIIQLAEITLTQEEADSKYLKVTDGRITESINLDKDAAITFSQVVTGDKGGKLVVSSDSKIQIWIGDSAATKPGGYVVTRNETLIRDEEAFTYEPYNIIKITGPVICTGNLFMEHNNIHNLKDPVNSYDAANKKYVDSKDTSVRSYIDSKISEIASSSKGESTFEKLMFGRLL